MDKARAHVYISGYVQGVFFRANTRVKALQLGVTGWVRNLPDGRVEALFEGDAESVRQMVQWCRSGPPGAEVEDVAVSWEPFKGEFRTFSVAY